MQRDERRSNKSVGATAGIGEMTISTSISLGMALSTHICQPQDTAVDREMSIRATEDTAGKEGEGATSEMNKTSNCESPQISSQVLIDFHAIK